MKFFKASKNSPAPLLAFLATMPIKGKLPSYFYHNTKSYLIQWPANMPANFEGKVVVSFQTYSTERIAVVRIHRDYTPMLKQESTND